jgi:hypothetical protein
MTVFRTPHPDSLMPIDWPIPFGEVGGIVLLRCRHPDPRRQHLHEGVRVHLLESIDDVQLLRVARVSLSARGSDTRVS